VIRAAWMGFVLVAGLAGAQTVPAHRGGKVAHAPGVILVELFTSEGCSTCPPADALLGQVNGVRTPGGDLIVGISEHVTYWNQLGWRDPFSLEVVTERQRAYSHRFQPPEVYTPQMVVNGESAFVGSDRESLLKALMEAEPATGVRLHIAAAKVDGDALAVTFSFKAMDGGAVDLYAVVAEDAASMNVLRGENAGRKLSHVAVAMTFVKLEKTEPGMETTVRVPLRKPAGGGSGKRHLIVFAQRPGLGAVVGADTVPF
jgi:hypothetical protein